MLAKVFRLTHASEFKLVKEKGRLFHSKNFTLSVFDRGSGDNPRFGFVIPNKIVPLSVERNRIKRILSEATRFQIASISPTVDCVFLPKPIIASAYAEDLVKEVVEAFHHADIIKAV